MGLDRGGGLILTNPPIRSKDPTPPPTIAPFLIPLYCEGARAVASYTWGWILTLFAAWLAFLSSVLTCPGPPTRVGFPPSFFFYSGMEFPRATSGIGIAFLGGGLWCRDFRSILVFP